MDRTGPDPGLDAGGSLDERWFLDSTMRLQAAGVIESVVHDARSGNGSVRFTAAYHGLLMAGRRPLEEPQFVRAWLSGDPDEVRLWIEREAAALSAAKAESPGKPCDDKA